MRYGKVMAIGLISVLLVSGVGMTLGYSRDVEIDSSTADLFSGGSGTESDPYQISNVTQLQNMNKDLDAHYELIEDIDASVTKDWNNGSGFMPVGKDDDERFSGSLDGKGYNIRGLYINRPSSDYVGLFGSLGGVTVDSSVERTCIVDSNISGNRNVGLLVGENFYGNVKNSCAQGNVSGNEKVGGLIGINHGEVNNSYTIGHMSGDDNTGGLVGYNGGTVNNSYAMGNVSGDSIVGGLVGWNHGSMVNNSYAMGNVSGEREIGGLVGDGGTVKNSYARVNMSGNYEVGGLVGDGCTVKNSHYNIDEVIINGGHRITIGSLFQQQYQDWMSSNKRLEISDYSDTLVKSGEYYEISGVEGIKDILGFAGEKQYKFCLKDDIDLSSEPGLYIPYFAAEFDGNGYTIKNLHLNWSAGSNLGFFGYLPSSAYLFDTSLARANVRGTTHIGGLVGFNDEGMVNNSYATGGVVKSSITCVGGLIGLNHGTVKYSYTTGEVNGNSSVGGLVGENWGSVNNSYADGNVKGNMCVGTLVGMNVNKIERSYARGNVNGNSSVGGLAGLNWAGTVRNSYATANVNGNNTIGGLLGGNIREGRIKNSYATGNVSGNERVGGLVGDNSATVNNSLWDINTTSQSSSNGGTGKTTTEMKDIDTFTDTSTEGLEQAWDFVEVPNDDDGTKDIWKIDEDVNDGYPFLVCDRNTTPPTADAGEDKTVGIDEDLTFDGSSSTDNVNITDYTWTIEGDEYEGESVTHSFSEVGTYEVELTVTYSSGNSDSDSITVTVEDDVPPTVSVDIYGDLVEGEEITVDASESADNVGIESIECEFGDGTTATGANVTHTYEEAGDYTVNVTVTDEAGNIDEYQETITVEEESDGDNDTPGFTLMILLFSLSLVAIYRYRKKKR
ncbi:MAG: PKD domain-containing protein [Candidatus Saliniplasma sp.]